jgi:ABC-type polysaccharide/polyol phosphate transport system ATPase subunit
MYARLGFSIAIHLKREILLVDEVLGVGDAQFQNKCQRAMEKLMKEGHTIILVSHNVETLKTLSERVVWLENGSVKKIGHPQTIVAEYLQA